MKYCLISFICCLFTLNSYGQDHVIDSLEKQLKVLVKNDTNKINLYLQLASAYSDSNPNKCISYASQAITLAEKFNQHKIFIAFKQKADGYSQLGQDSLAVLFYNKSIASAKKAENKKWQGMALNNLANLYNEQSHYKKSLDTRLEALHLFEALADQQRISIIMSNIGSTYSFMGDFPKSLNYYFKVLRIADSLNDIQSKSITLKNIGLIFKKAKNYKNALIYYQKALELNRKSKDKLNEADVLSSIATLYDDTGQSDKALANYQEALRLNREIQFKRGEINSLTNIGVVYSGQKKYEEAISSLTLALKQALEISYEPTIAVIYNELSAIYIDLPPSLAKKMGMTRVQQFQEAEKYARESLKLSQKTESIEKELEAWYTLSEIHNLQNNYKEAYNDFKNYTTLKDSVLNEQKVAAIVKAEMEYESEKADLLAKKEVEKQKLIKNNILIGLIVLSLLASAIFYFYKKHRDSKQKQKELDYKARVSDIEMKVLRLQMNPHFIFNSLNSISDYINKNDIKSADYYLSKFAKLMRGILENAEEKEIPLAEDLKMLEIYMQLESVRLKQKFNYEIKISPDVDPNTTLVPPLIMQPFVENSIWHGFKDLESGKITIEINRNEDMINCIVEDDGKGFKQNKVKKEKSYGVKITKDRIELLNKLKNTNAKVNVINLNKGTRVELDLPYETEL